MKERPILFSAPMIRALLDGTKTQTRRIVKPQPDGTRRVMVCNIRRGGFAWNGAKYDSVECPYGDPGDRLWVRETWAYYGDDEYLYQRERGAVQYRATDEFSYSLTGEPRGDSRWRPSIHMPRWASRLTLTITDVRVQRLQEISEEDATAEGCNTSGFVPSYNDPDNSGGAPEFLSAREEFAELWNSINGPAAWERNDWVWALTFERVA